MIAVLKGDIVASRKLKNPELWLNPIKELLGKWGQSPKDWELVWGDLFQVEITRPEDALLKAIQIKVLLKQVQPVEDKKRMGTIDVRMSMGIGDKTYTGERISESNGPAFVHAGEKFENLKKEYTRLAIKSPWPEFDREMNLYLSLINRFMDKWSVSSAQLMQIVLNQPSYTQEKIGAELEIKQNSVSGRWRRACVDEILAVESRYREKIVKLLT
ncbi:MAG: hypothetical protein HYZ16_12500 [Bacteroidetes bacterium]|jgi:hypothetical protein|nr:hypothetical protein [Bacteroidota bacterium]